MSIYRSIVHNLESSVLVYINRRELYSNENYTQMEADVDGKKLLALVHVFLWNTFAIKTRVWFNSTVEYVHSEPSMQGT